MKKVNDFEKAIFEQLEEKRALLEKKMAASLLSLKAGGETDGMAFELMADELESEAADFVGLKETFWKILSHKYDLPADLPFTIGFNNDIIPNFDDTWFRKVAKGAAV